MPVASLAYAVIFLTAKFWTGGMYKRMDRSKTNPIGIKKIIPIHFIHFLIFIFTVYIKITRKRCFLFAIYVKK